MNHIVGIGKKLDAPFLQCRRPITLKGAQNQHELIFGGSGSGKSNALHFRARQDIKLKRGFVAIDTHGDLFDGLLDDLIAYGWAPENAAIINPVSARHWGFPGISLLEVAEQEPYEIVAEVVDAFCHSLFAESTGPRMQDLLRRCFQALQGAQLTIAEAEEFLTNAALRNAVVETLTNHDVKHFWTHHFNALRESDQRLISEAPRNKLSALLSHPALKNILCQSHSTIDFRALMDSSKCCLINLSRNHLKQDARNLFASLLLSRLVVAILSREEVARERRAPCTLYLDEAAEYFHSPDSFLTIATGARKFNVALKMFAQSPFMFGEHVDILLTNANIACFNIDYKSGERLVHDLFPITGQRIKFQPDNPKAHPTFYSLAEERSSFINELIGQRPGECVIKIRGADNPSPFLAAVPLMTPFVVDPEAKQAFCEASAKRYYRAQHDIEEERRQRLARWLVSPAATTRNRS